MTVRLTLFEHDLLLTRPETRKLTRRLLTQTMMLEGSKAELDRLRDACGDALQRNGFDEHWEPTTEGRALETLIDKLFV